MDFHLLGSSLCNYILLNIYRLKPSYTYHLTSFWHQFLRSDTVILFHKGNSWGLISSPPKKKITQPAIPQIGFRITPSHTKALPVHTSSNAVRHRHCHGFSVSPWLRKSSEHSFGWMFIPCKVFENRDMQTKHKRSAYMRMWATQWPRVCMCVCAHACVCTLSTCSPV